MAARPSAGAHVSAKGAMRDEVGSRARRARDRRRARGRGGKRGGRRGITGWFDDRRAGLVRWSMGPVVRRLLGALAAVTGAGWVVFVVALASIGVARVVGWVEAGAIAIVGLVVLGLSIAQVIGRTPHLVQVRLPQHRTVAGQTAMGEVVVRNGRSRRVGTGVIELPVGSGAGQFIVPALEPKEEWSEVFAVPTRRRGVIIVGPARSVRADALGMIRRVREWTEPDSLLVHPRTVRIPFDATGFQADVEGVTTAKLSSSDVSFHALRDYVPGDDRRHVHWATTARTGRLVVRQYEETRRSHHLILIDSMRSHWVGEDFEVGISGAASMALSGVMASRRVSFATSTGWVSTSAPMRMLDDLTSLDWAQEDVELAERLPEVMAQRPGISVLTLVVGPNATDEELAHLATAAGVEVTVGVVRIRLGRQPKRSRAGRAHVVDCPSLEDLPRLVARRAR